MRIKFTLATLLFLLGHNLLQAQVKKAIPSQDLKQFSTSGANNVPLNITEKCGFAYSMQQAGSQGFNSALYEQEMARLINERRQLNNFGPPTVIYTIPVIFHIIYDGNTETTIGTGSNISSTLVNAQLAQLNKDFADLSGSAYGVAEDMGVRFVAAKVDPAGNVLCTPGIERINWRSRTGWSNPATLASNAAVQNQYNNVVKPQSIWDPYRYVNIWLANFEASGLLGYASFPGQSTLPGLDNGETDLTAGVVILSGSVGSTTVPGSAAPYDYGRTLTHELGHFFGLRHITGDANCGDDYCGDTPPQDDLTGGCPATGTLNNCTPSVPKMFENYMDYSNDACLNTFTLNQSERCQVVMLNSPRRKELGLSTTGNSPIPNRIFFKSAVESVSETGTTGTCPRYRDYSIVLGVDVAASGTATVSLSKAGTATDNVDYSLLPSTVSYTNGDATDKTFTLRVFDDAANETAETIQLNINITGTGVQTSAACASVNQLTVTIADDDPILAINNTTPNPVLYTQDFGVTTGSNQVPTGWTFANGTTSTTNKWVGNDAGAVTYGFTGNTLHISNGNTAAVADGTAGMTYSSVSVGSDVRAFTPIINAQGLKNISVSFKLVCNGEFDEEFYDYGIVYYTLNGSSYSALTDINGNFVIQGITAATTLNFNLPAGAIGTSTFGLLFRWISDNTVANQPPFAIDDINVTGTATTVESQLNSTAIQNIPSTSGAAGFYSTADGQVIASLANASANVGCVTAIITSAGNGTTPLTTSSGAYLRSQKVIRLSPATANSTATYQATFYFTSAELAAWGPDVLNLKILKVTDGVNLATTLTASNSTIFTPTVNDQRATAGYVAYTINATGGFSQFMLASPLVALPVQSLDFTARANGKDIVLAWKTMAEVNNKGFVIERSTDAIHFETIAWKDGAINSSQAKNYGYTDNYVQPNQWYHYRLRQTDLDGREALSEIRQARINEKAGLLISISPNPAKNQVKIFTSGTVGLSNINLLDAKGRLVQTWRQVNCSSAPQTLDISKIAAGVYMVQVITGDVITTEKLIVN